MSVRKISLVWLRNDLRLHDHMAIVQAMKSKNDIMLVYCFDYSHFKKSNWPHSTRRMSGNRIRFLLESLEDLSNRIPLCYVKGNPPDALETFINTVEHEKNVSINQIFVHGEVGSQESNTEKNVLKIFKKKQRKFNVIPWGSVLHHPDDIKDHKMDLDRKTLQSFMNYRNKGINKFNIPVREHNVINPSDIPIFSIKDTHPEYYSLPSIKDLWELGEDSEELYLPKETIYHGGETKGIERVKHYIGNNDLIHNYKETRNGLLGNDYSSKFSPWMNLGCISPIFIHNEMMKLSKSSDSSDWLIVEMMFRDYFLFHHNLYGDKYFYLSGVRMGQGMPSDDYWNEDVDKFNAWKEGRTGVPFIDANMRELKETGFMSNRGRQCVASFLAHDLKVDWRWGAAYFEVIIFKIYNYNIIYLCFFIL